MSKQMPGFKSRKQKLVDFSRRVLLFILGVLIGFIIMAVANKCDRALKAELGINTEIIVCRLSI